MAVPQQDAIDVYPNGDGDVVIYQSVSMIYQNDQESHIFVRPENATALCAAIMECARGLGANVEPIAQPKDPTGAERQRRYRARQSGKSSAP